MALQHHRATLLQFINDSRHYVRVIVAHIVDTVSGKKVQDATAIVREQLNSHAPFIADRKIQHFQQLHPLRVYVLGSRRESVAMCSARCMVVETKKLKGVENLRWIAKPPITFKSTHASVPN